MNASARAQQLVLRAWQRVGTRWLPFADAGTRELPLPRLLRLSLFQVSVGMSTALLVGTLNRVMIVEFGVHAWLVAAMVAAPLLVAPLRALIGFRSDTHVSPLGWRRVPFLWIGSLLQFGGLAIMPFALLILSGTGQASAEFGQVATALAFLLVGAGLHVTQTAGLALAADLAPAAARPRVVALLYVMLLVGVAGGSLLFGALLDDFTPLRLIQVVQGAAMLAIGLNLVALWKQEARDPTRTERSGPPPDFGLAWRAFRSDRRAVRFLVAVGLGTAAFNMQDIVLEPYGAEVLGLSVAATTLLTALLAVGGLLAFALAAYHLTRGANPLRLAAYGAVAGLVAFAAVVLAAPLQAAWLFRVGTLLIGFGGGLFGVGTLTAAMGLDTGDRAGLALGAWGAVQATSAGLAIAAGGALRDLVDALAMRGVFGAGFADAAAGYSVVYHLELGLLFATLVAIGPLVGHSATAWPRTPARFGLAEFPS